MKLLSVVVPSYNSEAWLRNCLDSLVPGGERLDVIVIDDGSSDQTGAIADEYAAKYPEIIRAVHQENGGHGEGINQGILRAEGRFFKVVDSDDRLSDVLPAFLDLLEGSAYDADLVLNNFIYKYSDGRKDSRRSFTRYFPVGRMSSWDDMKPLEIDKFLMIHACTFRTEVVRKSGIVLPKHMFYEDNYYITAVLPYVEKIWCTDMDLYLYTIGREGQSTAGEAMTRRYKHHLYIGEATFKCCRLDEVKEKSEKLYRIMFHEMRLLLGIGSVFSRLSDDPEAEEGRLKMWKNAYDFDEKYAKKIRRSVVWLANIPGKAGKAFARGVYKLAWAIVKFN